MMNRKNHTHIAALGLMLLLTTVTTGCSLDEVVERRERSKAVSFATEFTRISTRSVSTLDNIWPNASVISISNGLGKTYRYKTAENSSTLSSGEAATLLPVSDVIYWENPNVIFSAWYPAGPSAPSSFSVNANQSKLNGTTGISDVDYLSQDLLYCPPEITRFTYQQQEPIALKFHHQLARVIVKVNSSFTEGQNQVKEKVEGITFGGGHLGLSGTISPSTTGENGSTGWTITDSQNSSITMRDVSVASEMSNNLYTFECMVLPQQYNGQADLIIISTSGSVDETDRTYTYKNSFTLESGYQYTYNLVISEQGSISFATVEVTDWQTGTAIENTATIPDSSYSGNN